MSKVKNKLKPIDSPVYSHFSALYLSFFSNRLYVDVGKRWKGLGLIYLLLVIGLFSIPFSLYVGANFNRFFSQQIIEPILKMPTLYVQNGEASIDEPMPYLIKNKKEQVVLIIDTTGAVTDFTPEYPNLNILINKDKITYRIPTAQLFNVSTEQASQHVPIVQSFNKEVNSVFDGKKLVNEGAVTGLKYASQLMIYPLIVMVFYSFFLVMFLTVALLAQLFARIFFSFQITYAQACRLLIVASTPMLLVLYAFLTANVLFAGMGIILLALLGAYYSYALYSLRSESLQVVAP